MQLRKGKNEVELEGTDIDKLVSIVRAVSWVESRHGTGTGIQPSRDPMQCGNPTDVWWPQLAGVGTKFDRFVGGPGAGKFNANQLPVEAAQAGLESLAQLSRLTDVKAGHKDSAFNSTMSFFWGVPHLVWKINRLSGRNFFLFETLSRDELINGAVAYNGGGNPNYRSEINAALEDAGWPSVVNSITQLAEDNSYQALTSILDILQQNVGSGQLFPHGLSRFVLETRADGWCLEIDASAGA